MFYGQISCRSTLWNPNYFRAFSFIQKLYNVFKYRNICKLNKNDSVAQWIRRWSTEPEILGSIPSEVEIILEVFLFN